MSATTMTIKPRRRYDAAFKQDAVNRVIRTGKSCAEVARELGVRSTIVARWRQEHLARADQSAGSDSESMKPSELVAALAAARREAEELREQRDILKKALRIFSLQSPNGGQR
ncbi:MAG TPA: transposase [Kiritimatiellia bacterium]|nr:transposase [Kiritimatiellia bacterium]HMP00848.1 transposase [Kiritimatiellia bacterium]